MELESVKPRSKQSGRINRGANGLVTEYRLDVIVKFDGNGGFRVWAYLDGAPQISARYSPPRGRGYFQSEKYYFKHGVYSKDIFPYTLTSRDMRVRKVKLSQ